MPRRQTVHTPSRRRLPSMDRRTGKPLLPPAENPERPTIVLDLDETLVYAREGPVHWRPQLSNFVAVLGLVFETVVWTAGSRDYAKAVVEDIDPSGIIKHCIYRHPKWFPDENDYTKDLRLLNRDMSRVLIIENTPDCVRKNPQNAILLPDYTGPPQRDDALGVLTQVVQGLAASNKPVPDYLASCPLLTQRPIDVQGGTIDAYTITATPSSPLARISRKLSFTGATKSQGPRAPSGSAIPFSAKKFANTKGAPWLNLLAIVLFILWTVLRIVVRFAARAAPFRKLVAPIIATGGAQMPSVCVA